MYSAPYAADSDSIANTAVKAALLDKLCIDIITRFFSALCYTYQAGNGLHTPVCTCCYI